MKYLLTASAMSGRATYGYEERKYRMSGKTDFWIRARLVGGDYGREKITAFLVTRDLPAGVVAAGVPARVMREVQPTSRATPKPE